MAIGNLEAMLAVNPFVNKVEIDKKPESVQEVEMPDRLDEAVEKMIGRYQELEKNDRYKYTRTITSKIEVDLLTPAQIELFVFQLAEKDLLADYNRNYLAAAFIANLIQKSYDFGNNNFSILSNESADYLGGGLQGSLHNKISLKIYRNIRSSCGEKSQDTIINLYGDSNYSLGVSSKNCIFNVYGNDCGHCGFASEKSQFNIYGNADILFGSQAKEGIFTVYGDINNEVQFSSYDCTFRTASINTFEKLVDMVMEKNKVQLLDAHGKVIQEMKK